MGKMNGFLEFDRQDSKTVEPLKRIKNFKEFHKTLSPTDRANQAARCMDCGVPFCQYGKEIQGMTSGCPLNNLIPEWNDLIYRDNYKEALSRLLKTNNFPEFTSRVCPALCEKACVCSLNGDAVTVKDNEYGIIEYGYAHGYMAPVAPTVRIDKTIAVIGSGPAGLAAADQLNKRGYHVDVLERDDRFGGLLMYGIPQMKIEKSVIERTINRMEQEGVQFFANKNITTKEQTQELLKKYDAVILACGARQARDIQVEGRQASNVMFAVDYLTGVTKSLLDSDFKDGHYVNAKDKKVLVIGGGDTGNDCVGTAIRHGCESVLQLEMMKEPPLQRTEENPWPLWPLTKKTDYGQEESLAVFKKDPRLYQTTVKSFVQNEEGQVIKAILIQLEEKTVDGMKRMMPIEGSEKEIDVDLVFIAAGFIGSELNVVDAFGVKTTPRQNVQTVKDFKTDVEKVYVAGDMRRGQSLVVWAIREGRDVARQVDEDLMGYSSL